MKNIIIKEDTNTKYFPLVDFDAQSEICEISGESYMEDCQTFYDALMDWLNEYFQTSKRLTFVFKLTYWNTSSSKCIIEMLHLIKQYEKEGNNLIIKWYCDKEDIDVIKEISDFKTLSGLNIEIINS